MSLKKDEDQESQMSQGRKEEKGSLNSQEEVLGVHLGWGPPLGIDREGQPGEEGQAQDQGPDE